MTRERSRWKPEHRKDKMDMTPMIDCVFLLLIYFMLIPFKTPEDRMDAQLPERYGLNEDRDRPPPPPVDWVRLHIGADRQRRPLIRIHNQQPAGWPELVAVLRRIKVTNPDSPVLINGKPNVPFCHIIAALNCCAVAEMAKVEFMAPEVVER